MIFLELALPENCDRIVAIITLQFISDNEISWRRLLSFKRLYSHRSNTKSLCEHLSQKLYVITFMISFLTSRLAKCPRLFICIFPRRTMKDSIQLMVNRRTEPYK